MRQDNDVYIVVEGKWTKVVDVTDDDHEDLEGNDMGSTVSLWDKPHEEYDLTDEQLKQFGLDDREQTDDDEDYE